MFSKESKAVLEMLFWLLSPTCSMCTWTVKRFLGNVASRAKEQTLLLGMAPCCICLVGILASWRKLDSISIPTSLLENSWASSKQIFCWVSAILLLCLLGFEYPSVFMASEVTSWLSQRVNDHRIIFASNLSPWCLVTSVER